MPNRLGAETSPYLLQHQDNPVDWWPWGEAAIARAREEDKPLLVSIGYSACHWCHVMAHESFEDPEIARLMSEHFVPIKVDREERPDVDAVCMEACQAMTGRGGWPLNAFLTPDGVPFYAGTYFPPEPRHGMPSWRMVLLAVADAWDQRRDQIRDGGGQIVAALQATTRLEPSAEPIGADGLAAAAESLRESYDPVHGGFGGAPKFPPTSTIEFLLGQGEREMSLETLRAMASGGIYDQLGGGFARYSVDATWTVPHFEKMLYDNALLARAYLHGWQVAGEARLREVCCETLGWALREMRAGDGGFCSALDADSEGVEGKYYVWSEPELRDALGELYEPALAYFEPKRFEHGLVLEARGPRPGQLPEIRERLLAVRERRVRPGLDDKRLTSWNALMISALADAGATLEREDYLAAARACAEFVLRDRRTDEGALLRTATISAFLDDHAFLLEALLTLYEATFEPRWYHEAVAVAQAMVARFEDPERGGFFTTASAADETTPAFWRRKDLEDSPIPSGNSAAAFGLLRLARLSGEGRFERHALGVLRLLYPIALRHPSAFGHLLQAAGFYRGAVREVALVGPADGVRDLVRVVRGSYRPHLVLAGGASDGVPLLEDRAPVDGRATAYVCEHFICQRPMTEPAELAALLEDAPARPG